MDNFKNLETAIGGLFIAICYALGPRAESALDLLGEFISDSRTGDYERQLYADLLDCIDRAMNQPRSFDFDELVIATLH